MSPSDYFSEFECNDAFDGNFYFCINDFLDKVYCDKEYMQHILSADEYAAYLDDTTLTSIPSPVRKLTHRDCIRCIECSGGDCMCDYYQEPVSPDTDIDYCTHFILAESDEHACILIYNDYYVVENIIVAADATELDAVEYFKEFGNNKEKSEIVSILDSPDYDPNLWRFSPMSC